MEGTEGTHERELGLRILETAAASGAAGIIPRIRAWLKEDGIPDDAADAAYERGYRTWDAARTATVVSAAASGATA